MAVNLHVVMSSDLFD